MSNPSRGSKSRASKKHGKKRDASSRKSAPPTRLEILERLLFRKMRISLNGEKLEVTAIEAILYQLLQKDAVGDGRASSVLLKYEEFARHGSEAPLQIAFVDSDYTQTLAASIPEAGHG